MQLYKQNPITENCHIQYLPKLYIGFKMYFEDFM